MKNIINQWLYIAALLPQFLFEDYMWLVITVILIGGVSRFFLKDKRVFVKLFCLELIVFTIVFFIFQDRVFYLQGVFESIELPSILLSIVFVIFNALNIAILFFTGYKLTGLFTEKTEAITSVEI